MLTVVITSLLLLIADPQGAAASAQEAGAGAVAESVREASSASEAEQEPAREPTQTTEPAEVAGEPASEADAEEVAKATQVEAERAFGGLKAAAVKNLPKLALVLVLLVAAWAVVRVLRFVLRRWLGHWPRSSALIALSGITVWLVTIGVAVTVVAGDVRAFLGSVGLLGLAASWALQTPIESFTGWLLNAFKGYYRVGDRVEVGEIFGDVHRIDVLTTTVWEIGSPFRPGFVAAEQPTGRLITFPNKEILTGSVMNLTRDFLYAWDELAVAVANESDLRYARDVLLQAATDLLGERMRAPAQEYEQIMRRAGLDETVSPVPQVFLSTQESWTNLYVRYLVHARQRRHWKSELILRVAEELSRSEHQSRIIPVVPRQQVQLIGDDGRPRNADWFASPGHGDATEESP